MGAFKICPKCDELVSFNSYFGAYICRKCGFYRTEQLKEVEPCRKYRAKFKLFLKSLTDKELEDVGLKRIN